MIRFRQFIIVYLVKLSSIHLSISILNWQFLSEAMGSHLMPILVMNGRREVILIMKLSVAFMIISMSLRTWMIRLAIYYFSLYFITSDLGFKPLEQLKSLKPAALSVL